MPGLGVIESSFDGRCRTGVGSHSRVGAVPSLGLPFCSCLSLRAQAMSWRVVPDCARLVSVSDRVSPDIEPDDLGAQEEPPSARSCPAGQFIPDSAPTAKAVHGAALRTFSPFGRVRRFGRSQRVCKRVFERTASHEQRGGGQRYLQAVLLGFRCLLAGARPTFGRPWKPAQRELSRGRRVRVGWGVRVRRGVRVFGLPTGLRSLREPASSGRFRLENGRRLLELGLHRLPELSEGPRSDPPRQIVFRRHDSGDPRHEEPFGCKGARRLCKPPAPIQSPVELRFDTDGTGII